MRSVRTLGQGGMGVVELVARTEGNFQREYARKRLRAELRNDDAARSAFIDEGRIMGVVQHPNVVRVVDVGEDEQGPYLVMEYVQGMSFSAFARACVAQGTSLPLPVILEIMRDVAAGLRAAHEATDLQGQSLGVLHRDISPDNILLGRDGIARLTDFGIAKALGRQSASTRNILKGKLGYMAPERLRFEDPTVASDLWSFGVVLFEAIAEERLYTGETKARQILHEPPPDLLELAPETPPRLVQLVLSLLAKDPSARPDSAGTVARELDATLSALTEGRDPCLALDFVTEWMPGEEQAPALR
ncbi:MAG: serine/threonine-protein kinase [Myxococcota bacterium]